MNVLMSTKNEQFKLYLSPEFIEELHRLAEKYGKESGQQVAKEVLTRYVPVWSSVNNSIDIAVQKQSEDIISNVSETTRRPKGISKSGERIAPAEKAYEKQKKRS